MTSENRVCYFCGNYGTDEHHVLPTAVSKYITELSHGTMRLESVATIWLCNSCHRKYHKIIHPLALLALLDARNVEMTSLERPIEPKEEETLDLPTNQRTEFWSKLKQSSQTSFT